MTDVMLPDDIDQTFSTDVTDAVNAFLSSRRPWHGEVLHLPETRFIVNKTIQVPSGLTMDCTGAMLVQTTDGTELNTAINHARTRSFFDMKNCIASRLTGVRAIGANANGGLGGSVTSLEAQHVVNVIGGYMVVVDHVVADHFFGDTVYVGGACRTVRVHDIWGSYNGRQGISVCEGTDIVVENVDLKEIAHSVFDVEPLGKDGGLNRVVDGVIIRHGNIGRHNGNLLASKGGGTANNVQLSDMTCTDTVNAEVVAAPGRRRKNYTMVNCKTTDTGYGEPSGAVAKFTGVDGVICCYNEQPKSQERITVFAKFTNCTDYQQSHNVVH